MRTGALHRSAALSPTRAIGRERPASSATGPGRPGPANQDSANQGSVSCDQAAPAVRRHDVEAFGGTAEPTLVDVLNEPIVRTMMRRDGVALATLQRVMGEARLVVVGDPD